MLTDAVELGVACFLDMQDADDSAIVERLGRLGVSAWLADRLLVWLPIAFGRSLLSTVQFSNEYLAQGLTGRLEDDPVFRACAARAAHMNRDEARAIASRSAEVAVINAVLAGAGESARLTDNDLSPPALASALPPIEPDHGGVPEPRMLSA